MTVKKKAKKATPKRGAKALPMVKMKRHSASVREDASPYNVRPYRFIDLFCGIGGFRIAFEKAGGKCVFSSDYDKYSQQTYVANFG